MTLAVSAVRCATRWWHTRSVSKLFFAVSLVSIDLNSIGVSASGSAASHTNVATTLMIGPEVPLALPPFRCHGGFGRPGCHGVSVSSAEVKRIISRYPVISELFGLTILSFESLFGKSALGQGASPFL